MDSSLIHRHNPRSVQLIEGNTKVKTVQRKDQKNEYIEQIIKDTKGSVRPTLYNINLNNLNPRNITPSQLYVIDFIFSRWTFLEAAFHTAL